MTNTRPPEGAEAELYWLRGYEAGVATMRIEKPVNMLCDIYQRHMNAARDGDEPLRQRLSDLITEFEWAFPDVADEHKRRFAPTTENAELRRKLALTSPALREVE